MDLSNNAIDKIHHYSKYPHASRENDEHHLPINFSLEIEDQEFEEALGLLGRPIVNHTDFEEETPQGRKNSARAWIWWILTIAVVILWSQYLNGKEILLEASAPPRYECPPGSLDLKKERQQQQQYRLDNINKPSSPTSTSSDRSGQNDPFLFKRTGGESLNNTYIGNASGESKAPNAFAYEDLKENIHGWTIQTVAPRLLNCSRQVSILETSSHSIGLNLLMTLEILEERQQELQQESGDKEDWQSTQFHVYGTNRDSCADPFSLFFQGYDHPTTLSRVKLGTMCAAGPSSLPLDPSYIPANSFNMVYTGHLPLLEDPLGFGMDDTLSTKYESLCNSTDQDWQGTLLKEVAQQTQEEWVAQWVYDMARVVRPGGLLVVENMGLPFCDDDYDRLGGDSSVLGGVSEDWWAELFDNHAVEWRLVASSLKIQKDDLRPRTYHVAIHKQEASLPVDD